MATPHSTPKTMSSRLLTMKFMQRAAAGTPSPASSTATPDTNEHSSKRRKTSQSPAAAISVDPLVNQKAIQAALDEGERKRQRAIEKQAEELGDARWVLNVRDDMSNPSAEVQKPLNVVQIGFAQIDSTSASYGSEDSFETSPDSGLIRRYNMVKQKDATESSDSEDESSTDSSDTDSSQDRGSRRKSYGASPGTSSGNDRSNAFRAGLQNKRKAEKAKAKELAEKRRRKEVKLNMPRGLSNAALSGISSGGHSPSISAGAGAAAQRRADAAMKCYSCGKLGHKASACPSKH